MPTRQPVSRDQEQAEEKTHTILWVDRNPHDTELARLVLARLAPQFEIAEVSEVEELERVIEGSHDISLAVVGDHGRESMLAYPTDSRSKTITFSTKARKALRRTIPDVPALLFSEIQADEGLQSLREGFDDFMQKSSRSFLELPQFLTRALNRDTERRRRHDRDSRLSRLLEYSRVGVFRASLDGKIEEANQAFLELFGLHDLDDAQDTDFSSLVGTDPERPEEAPLRETRNVVVGGVERCLRVTKLVLITPSGSLKIDGMIEEVPPRSPASAAGPVKQQPTAVTTGPKQAPNLSPLPQLRKPLPTDRPALASHPPAQQKSAPTSKGHVPPAIPTAEAQKTTWSRVAQAPPERVALDLVLKKALNDLAAPLERAQAQVHLAPLPQVRGDSSQLGILFRNLLENAIRFRDEGPLRIQISSREVEETVVVSIKDNGVGMSPSTLRRVLGSSSDAMFSDPSGRWSPLGLAISRRILEHHQGRLTAESEPGRGTTFHVTLPRVPQTADPSQSGTN